MKDTYDLAVIGLGLAGLSLLDAISQRQPDWRLLGLDQGQVAGGASSAPGALLNPLPGRSLLPRPSYQQAHAFAGRWLQQWQSRTQDSWLHSDTMIRPLWEDDPVSHRLLRSWKQRTEDYGPHLSISHLSSQEVQEKYPGFVETDGAMELSPVYAVAMHEMLSSIVGHLSERAIELCPDAPTKSLRWNGNHWNIQGKEQVYQARRVAFCVGAHLGDWFPDLPLQWMGGELVMWKAPDEVEWPCAFRQKGHLVPMPRGYWVGGSTYNDISPEQTAALAQQHSYLDEWILSLDSSTGEEVAQEMANGISRLFPAVQQADVDHVWRGVRGIYRHDRQPLVGPVPEQPHLFVCSALASKGLLLGPYLADHLAEEITTGNNIVPSWARSTRSSDWSSKRILV